MHPILTFLVISSVRPNAPHSDLLSDIQVFIAEHNLADRVTVHKVTSHCDTEFAFDDGEAWIFWHNKLVDAAADGFNARLLDVLLLFGRSWKKCGQQYNLADSLFWIFGRSLFTLVGCSHNASCQQTMWQGRKSRNQWRLLSQSLNLWWSRGTILRL